MKISAPVVLILLLYFLSIACEYQGQSSSSEKPHYETPSLVVGIIIDQMRPDYVYRYWDHYGDDGFKRFVNEGFIFRNAHFRHLQTATGPGHAASLTGATPSIHGLIGNSFYIRELDRTVNVIEDIDSRYIGVGSFADYDGEKSPNNMLTTTVGDELHLHTGERSKTIGISRKDRGAILPAGHTGDAYWYERASGNFITSSYYRDLLPDWLIEFNNLDLSQEYLKQTWNPLLPIEKYVESRPDDSPYERPFSGMDTPTFPINLSYLVDSHDHGPELLLGTPFLDKILLELGKAAIEGEKLGRRGVPDILSISLSAADRIGHMFGPASKQLQDYYIRLDRYIADFLSYLDQEFGMENILIYLTSDHGAVYNSQYLSDLGVPTGHDGLDIGVNRYIQEKIQAFLKDKYGVNILLTYSNQNIYLDHDLIYNNELDLEQIRKEIKRFSLTLKPVGGALTADVLNRSEFTEGIRAKAMYGYHQKRSGDVVVWLNPQTVGGTGGVGTTHGSPWTYDTHAPLIFFGYDIQRGESNERVHVSDIASTLSVFLNSPFPSGNIGNPMNDYINK